MTAQAIAGVLAGLLIAATAAAIILERRRRRLDTDLWIARRDNDERVTQAASLRELLADERVRATRAEEHAEHARAALRAANSNLVSLEADALDRERRTSLEGKLVVVNTPRPDDQTIRGVCRRELFDDEGRPTALVLEAAEYVDSEHVRGEDRARRTPIGTVTVPAYSFAQHVPPRQGDAELEEV